MGEFFGEIAVHAFWDMAVGDSFLQDLNSDEIVLQVAHQPADSGFAREIEAAVTEKWVLLGDLRRQRVERPSRDYTRGRETPG